MYIAVYITGIDRHLFCLYVMSRYCNEESPFLKKVSIKFITIATDDVQCLHCILN